MIEYDYKISFEQVAVGTESVQYFEIKDGEKSPNWTVVQKPDVDKNVNAFNLKKKVTPLGKNIKHEILVQYKPYQPCQKHVNYYLIKNLEDNDIVLKVEGYSKCLSVTTSVKHLNFYRFLNDFKTKIVFEIHNNSLCKINYQFDVDNNQKIFNIEPKCGEIMPERYCYITVKFVTEKDGLFFLDLPLLVHLHQPIYIELFGLNSKIKSSRKLKERRGQCTSMSLEDGFEKYMTEKFGFVNNKYIYKITPSNINFSTINCIVPIEIQNYSDYCIEILWNTADRHVEISPSNFHIRPNDRYDFQGQFVPKNLERFNGGQIYGHAFIFNENNDRNDPETVIIPLSLRYTGNAFYKTKIWTPCTELSTDIVSMPVCVKNRSVYSTFYIKKIGEYPVCFTVLPPSKKTNFQVKPMTGLIEEDFQILVVKFSPCNFSNSYFKEKWRIRLNYVENIFLTITFKAYVQEPSLVINENNVIDFGKVFPGCKKFKTVNICNNTQNKIKFSFHSNKWFTANPNEDIIDCYSSSKILWTYLADCDVPEKTILKYQIRLIEDNQVVSGLAYHGEVKIYAMCCYGKLCAIPTSYDFEAIVCGEPISTTFSLYNFSEVTLHFSLRVHNYYGNFEEHSISVKPNKGSILPQEHKDIEITVVSYNTGLTTNCVDYVLCESEDSDFLVQSKGPTFSTTGSIFSFTYYSYYPTLRFKEVGRNATGPLFGKLNVWDYFSMDNFNELLRTMKMNDTKQYFMRLPDAEAGLDIVKSIIVIVKNITRTDTEIQFIRKKVCTCELKEVTSALSGVGSFRKYSYEDCPHRRMLDIDVSENIVKAHQSVFINFEIRYLLFGPQEACYVMKFSHNRAVELYFRINGLKLGQLTTYYNGFNLYMNSVYIGELNPDLQTFWFLNNTRSDSSFELNTKPLIEYNKKWGYNVLVCLNRKGVAPAKTVNSIQFLFAPVAAGNVCIELPFKFGKAEKTLNIIGTALPYFVCPLDHIYFTEIGKEYLKLPDLLVNLSTEHIVLRNIPTHCNITRILTIRNIAPDKNIGFHVDCYYLEGILQARTIPSKGLLHPNERLPLILKVQTGGIATAIRVVLSIHLVDHTGLHNYFKTTAEFQKQIDARNDAFCYDGTGKVTYPKVPTVKVTPAPKVFHRVLAITCHIIDQIDMDVKMPIQDQLKHTPFMTIPIYNDTMINKFLRRPCDKLCAKKRIKPATNPKCRKVCCATFNDEEYIAVHTVLSCLLYDYTFSKQFKNQVMNFNQKSDRYYSEFKTELMTEEEELQQAKLVVNRIPKMLLAETMQVLLADTLLNHFKLGQYPFVQEESKEEDRKRERLSYGKIRYTEKFSFLLDNQ